MWDFREDWAKVRLAEEYTELEWKNWKEELLEESALPEDITIAESFVKEDYWLPKRLQGKCS